MLSKFDDYPIHQTAEPIAIPANSDRNVYDRYWFNGYARDGEFYFGIGLGVYPNRGIMDCGFSIVRAGEQHAFHASRRMGDPTDTEVGPFKIEILEPMRSCRLRIEPNETGIDCDLTFTGRTACIEEGRQTLRRSGRLLMDSTRFAQFGRWQGQIHYAGQTVKVDSSRVFGTKDRSWGVRPIGEPEAGGAPSSELPHIFFLWSPIHWDDFCTHYILFEDQQGHRWHEGGVIVPAYESADQIPGVEEPKIEHVASLDHGLVYEKGTRRARSAQLTMVRKSGEKLAIELEPLICFRMKGIGYTHPEWSHGLWKGELVVAGESWKCADLDELAFDNLHIQQVMRARLGDREGVGVMEQLAIGPHKRYGFKDLFDGAE